MTHFSRALFIVFSLSLAGLAACELDPADDLLGSASYDTGCPVWGCGANASSVELDELENSYDGNGNPTGNVQSLTLNGGTYRLVASDGELHADDDGTLIASGAEMVGAVMRVHYNSSVFDLEITGHSLEDSVVTSYDVPVYQLDYTEVPTGDTGELCPANGPIMAGAVLVLGERYDKDLKTVSAAGTAAADWINIVCVGTVLAKLKFSLYDPEFDSTHPYYTTPGQRQAMIKAYTADYCGTGRSFTVDGHALALEPRSGAWSISNTSNPEAIWDANGAIALDTPRLMASDPGILDDIIAECGGALPSWPDPITNWPTADADVKTYNP